MHVVYSHPSRKFADFAYKVFLAGLLGTSVRAMGKKVTSVWVLELRFALRDNAPALVETYQPSSGRVIDEELI